MKRLYILYVICFCCMVACKDDFDEIEDSNMRQISFMLDTSHIFDSVLVKQSGDMFAYGAPAMLDTDCRLRVTAYCYDWNDSLLQRQTMLENSLLMESLTFRHLDKEKDYHFVFVADVVKYDPYVDYYETWYQMDTRNRQNFYMFSDSRNEHPLQDVVYMGQYTSKPSNQDVDVRMTPLTYNGYCVFINTEKVDRLTGYAVYVNSFRLSSKAWLTRASLAYEYSYYRPTETSITLPLNLSYADSVVYVKAKSTTLAGTDSLVVNIPNRARRPFVLTIDCETSQLKEYKFY